MIVNGLTYVVRWLFFLIDNIIAFVIRLLYGLIIDIANASIMQDYIFTFMDRIYTFLAIFMVFKLSISMVNYILNPDQFTDKSKGFGKIIQNVIVVIALIIFVPTIFDWAYKLQCMVLNSGVLNTVITGKSSISDDFDVEESCFGDSEKCAASKELKKENGYMLTYSIFSAFVYQGSADNVLIDIEGEHKSAISLGNQTCEEMGALGTDNPNYKKASQCLFNISTITYLRNTYLVLLSTICLGFVAYVFIGFVIDISIRSVKLAFLQLIAPIPIISRLDPSSGKSGMFSKWVKECTKTYGDLFIRLGAVYFAIDLIDNVMHGEITMMNGCKPTIWIRLVIILAILSFAKQLPQFIENITGVKMSGDGLSLKKKFGQIPIVSGAVGTGAKKLVRGFDSVRNGNKFSTGFKSAHGKIYNSFDKWRSDWMPDTAEAVKNRHKGIKNQEARQLRENIGKPMGTDVNNALDAKARRLGYANADEWKADKYSDYAREKYNQEIKYFVNQEYKNSYSHLNEMKIQANDKQKEANDLASKYEAILGGQTITYKGVDYDLSNSDDFRKISEGAAAAARSAEGKVKAAEAAHEDVKLKNGVDANREKAYDEYGKAHKWNPGTSGTGGTWT